MLNYNEFTNSSKLEEKSNTYNFGCSMVYFNCPELQKIQAQINPDDLYTEDNDRYGIEDEHHVTLLYGLHSEEIEEADVMRISAGQIPPIRLANASAFESKDYDVLKFDADCPTLHEINKALCELPHTTDFPDYHPHATVAYFKKGKAADYIKQLEDISFEVTPSKIVYSKPDGSKTTQELN